MKKILLLLLTINGPLLGMDDQKESSLNECMDNQKELFLNQYFELHKHITCYPNANDFQINFFSFLNCFINIIDPESKPLESDPNFLHPPLTEILKIYLEKEANYDYSRAFEDMTVIQHITNGLNRQLEGIRQKEEGLALLKKTSSFESGARLDIATTKPLLINVKNNLGTLADYLNSNKEIHEEIIPEIQERLFCKTELLGQKKTLQEEQLVRNKIRQEEQLGLEEIRQKKTQDLCSAVEGFKIRIYHENELKKKEKDNSAEEYYAAEEDSDEDYYICQNCCQKIEECVCRCEYSSSDED